MGTEENRTKIIFRSALLLALGLLAIYISYLFMDLIVLLIISLLIAFIFNPVVTFLENHGMKRFLAVLIVFTLIGVIVVLGISFMIPKIVKQFNLLASVITKENINKLLLQIQENVSDIFPLLMLKILLPESKSLCQHSL